MSSYTEGQVHQLMESFERAGFTPHHVTELGQSKKNILPQLREVLRGRAEIKLLKFLIDCDSNPFLPDGWKMEEHKKGGQIQWDPEKVRLYLSSGQCGRVIEGNELRKELEEKPVLNANVLDFLLKKENQHLIPNEWKGKLIFFWGTLFRNSRGNLCVCCLSWFDGEWCWRYDLIDRIWGSNSPAVWLAS